MQNWYMRTYIPLYTASHYVWVQPCEQTKDFCICIHEASFHSPSASPRTNQAYHTYLYFPMLLVVVSSLSLSSSSIVMMTPSTGGSTWPSTVRPGLPSNEGTASGQSAVMEQRGKVQSTKKISVTLIYKAWEAECSSQPTDTEYAALPQLESVYSFQDFRVFLTIL